MLLRLLLVCVRIRRAFGTGMGAFGTGVDMVRGWEELLTLALLNDVQHPGWVYGAIWELQKAIQSLCLIGTSSQLR